MLQTTQCSSNHYKPPRQSYRGIQAQCRTACSRQPSAPHTITMQRYPDRRRTCRLLCRNLQAASDNHAQLCAAYRGHSAQHQLTYRCIRTSVSTPQGMGIEGYCLRSSCNADDSLHRAKQTVCTEGADSFKLLIKWKVTFDHPAQQRRLHTSNWQSQLDHRDHTYSAQ